MRWCIGVNAGFRLFIFDNALQFFDENKIYREVKNMSLTSG